MQFGRKQIFTDVTQITKDNVIKVLQDALIVHEQNRTAIKFLLDYERGIQPIDDRIKEIRPEINIKVRRSNDHIGRYGAERGKTHS